MSASRNIRRLLEKEAKKRADVLARVSRQDWPSHDDPTRRKVWISRWYLVQEFCKDGIVRLSVNRTEILNSGDWKAELSWDELQRIKHEVGYGNRTAVEIYPSDEHIVNVANMRHLWILNERIPGVGWYGDEE